MSAEKETYRFEAIKHRDRINPLDKNEDPDQALQHFKDSITIAENQIVAAYWPKGREFDPRGILEHLLSQDITCALPVVEKDTRILKFAQWDESISLQEGAYGIFEPVISDDTQWVQPDIVIVPLLAFDRKGHRLGYGGGYYDATLNALRAEKDVLAIGVAYAQQAVIFNLPTEPHDEKLDWIITPQIAQRY